MVEKQVRGPAVRGRLVEVADKLFTAKGASNVGVDEIVTNSGIAKSTLYRWFPAKDDLVVEYLVTRDAAFWEVWDEVSARHPDDPHAELVAQLEWLEAYIASRSFRGCPFLNTTAEFAEAEHRVRAAGRANKAELRRRLQELAQRMDARDPAALADQLVLVIDGAFATSQVFGRGGPQTHLVDAGRALVAVATQRKGRS